MRVMLFGILLIACVGLARADDLPAGEYQVPAGEAVEQPDSAAADAAQGEDVQVPAPEQAPDVVQPEVESPPDVEQPPVEP